MKHLDEVNETYWQHFKCAIYFSGTMLLIASACAIHALIPSLFQTTASTRLETLLKEMKRCKD